MKRICIVTPDLAGPTRTGGIGTHCLYLTRLLARRGEAVTIVHTGPPDDQDRAGWKNTYREEHGADLLFLDELPDEPALPVLPHTTRHRVSHRIYRWLRGQDFAAVHFQDWQGNGAISMRAKRAGAALTRTHLTVTAHGSSEWIREGMQQFPTEGREGLIDDALERAAVALADTLATPSRYMREWLRAHGWEMPEDTVVAPYVFDLPEHPPAARPLAPGALREIVFFGRLETRKGLEPFLTALERLVERVPDLPRVRVHLLGKHHLTRSGPSNEAIERSAAATGGKLDFEVHSELGHREALEFLRQRPDALAVLPSLADNLPFTVIECLGLGQPLLAANRGGIPELVGSSAHLVEPVAEALATRLQEIFVHGLAPCDSKYDRRTAEEAWSALLDRAPAVPAASALPRLSVCIPHHNQPALLRRALEALRQQSQPAHEVIVVDDGSETRCGPEWDALAREFAPEGWRFLRQENAGPSAARNHAAGVAQGDALVFCDSDNLPNPDMLERLAVALAHTGADVVTCAFTAFRAAPPLSGPDAEHDEYLFCPVGGFLELALLENFVGDVNFAIRRPVFKRLRGFDPANRAASEDWQLLLRALLAGSRIAVLPEPVFRYRLAPASHARGTSARISAEAAWVELPAARWPDISRLLLSVRGTFEDRPRLARLPEVEAVLRAVRQHARDLEILTRELRHELDSSLAHSANLKSLLTVREQELAEGLAHAKNLGGLLEVRERELAEALGHTENLRSLLSVREQELAEGLAHAKNLSGLLEVRERELAEALGHAANLQGLLELARNDVAASRQHGENLQQLLLTAERDLTAERARRAALDGEVDRLRAEKKEAEAAFQSALRARDDKITRMQRSFSWRITAPLRSLRRLLLDRRNPAQQGQAQDGREAAPNAQGYHFSVDQPTQWTEVEARRVTVAGWFLHRDGRPVKAIRALVDDEVCPASSGRKRLDVKAALPAHPHAGVSGFEVGVRLGREEGTVALEACGPDGAWVRFFQRSYSVTAGATDLAPDPFTRWIQRHEDFSATAREQMRVEVAGWTSPPLISVVMPVYNTPEQWLRNAISSVRDQIYPHWELCIADDASTAPHIRPLLEQAAREDSRVKVVFREANGHICAASNSALALASGEWVALLDHDDALAPHALFEVAAAAGRQAEAALIYSDEDKIDETGRRFDAYFKPDFLPELLEGQNFICHLGVYRTGLVRELGGFRAGLEGSQDWDLALRVVDHAGPGRVHHIPKILYHWRAIEGSTALHAAEKNYHLDAARRALEDHFRRRREVVELLGVPGGHWRVRHALPEPHPLVSIVIPTRNGLQLIRRCVESIEERTTYDRFEILIVDNGSDDPAMLAWLRDLQVRRKEGRGHTRVLRDDSPFNYSALNNRAVVAAKGEFVCLLNNDMEVLTPAWLEEMLSLAARPGAGAVGAMLYYPDDTIQHAGVVLGVGGVAGHAFKRLPRGAEGFFNRARLVQNYSAVTGACLLVRRAAYLAVGGLDEHDLSVAFNDVDFCLKLKKAGYRNIWTPFAEFYHHESASRGAENTPEKVSRFRREIEVMQQRWGNLLQRDPAYNPNLSLESEEFAIAPVRRL